MYLYEFPNLAAAVSLTSKTGNQCVQRAMALMLDMHGATLVFGVVRASTPEERAKDPAASPVPFIHAWLEVGERLFAPTLIERMEMQLRPILAAEYYAINGVTRTWKLPHGEFMKVARRWRLQAAIKHNINRLGKAEVADAVLKAAGVRYVLSDRRTLLPAP